MSIRILALFLLTALATGCSKDSFSPAKDPSSDFVLKRYREFPGGQSTLDVERALNIDDATSFNAQIQIKDQNLVLTLGGRKVNTVEPKLSASIVFLRQTDISKIAGLYKFPDDLAKMDVYFLENTPTGFYGRSYPASGTIDIRYDATTKTWGGTITKLKYEIPFRADYNYEEMNGEFSHVKFIPQ